MNKTPNENETTPAYSIDDFTEIEPLAKGWELKPDKFYLVVAPKLFNRKKLDALFDKMRDSGVQFGVLVVEGPNPRQLLMMEKKDEAAPDAV